MNVKWLLGMMMFATVLGFAQVRTASAFIIHSWPETGYCCSCSWCYGDCIVACGNWYKCSSVSAKPGGGSNTAKLMASARLTHEETAGLRKDYGKCITNGQLNSSCIVKLENDPGKFKSVISKRLPPAKTEAKPPTK